MPPRFEGHVAPGVGPDGLEGRAFEAPHLVPVDLPAMVEGSGLGGGCDRVAGEPGPGVVFDPEVSRSTGTSPPSTFSSVRTSTHSPSGSLAVVSAQSSPRLTTRRGTTTTRPAVREKATAWAAWVPATSGL